jgi:hypothetical protein
MINKLTLFIAILGLFFVMACNDDDEPSGPIDIENPSISLTDVGNVDGTIVFPGDTLRLAIDGQAGTNPLAYVRFFENGERLPNFQTRLFVNDSLSPTTQLNIAPESSIAEQLEIDIMILAPELGGNYDVEIELADADDNGSRVSLSYFVQDVVTIDGTLVNAAQADSTGGLDLDSGQGTGTDDANAEILDLGTNDDPPAENWNQQIEANDTSLVTLAVLPPDFDFDGVLTKARVQDSFNEGIEIINSEEVEVGDFFAVRRGDDAYILSVTAVNVTPDNDNDSYTFDIKLGQ